METKNIALLGSASYDNNNRGCQALTLGALNLICKNHHDVDSIIIVTPGDKKTQEHVINVDGKNVKLINQFCNKFDYYNFLPESINYRILKKTKNNFIKSFSNASLIYSINLGDGFTDIYGMKRLLMIFIEAFLVNATKKKIIFLPQTIGPFNTFWGKILSKYILKNTEKVFVRDKKANKYLKSIGVDYKEAFDLSVYMSPEPVDCLIEPNTVGINISGLLHFKTDLKDAEGFENYDLLVVNLIKELIKLNHKILLIPHTYNAENPEYADDLTAIKEIAAQVASESISIIDKNYTAPQLKYVISKCDFFIGSRMHSNFAALSTSTPVVGLGYSYKFQGGFEMFGVPECAISIKNISINDIQKIIQNIMDLLEQKEVIKQNLININNNINVLNI